ncbi:MAG: glycine--tRNA ligase subunit alpha [Candidatus Auribacterota bacterium]|nr:glycine--tRNA ligase subunit alpha [Candidatus Auribacterota bacterium]
MDFQTLILTLQEYWREQGCVLVQPYDMEVGAGTFAPPTFFGVLGPNPWKVGYVQPSRRPSDGRYGENPNRLYQHHQYQVILKPAPGEIQNIYLSSLKSLGIDFQNHDIRFVEDDWESPTLGASGLGWEVWCDGLEITQFTYFQQMGGFELDPIPVELTYGLERIAMFLQEVDNVFDLEWGSGISYREMRKKREYEFSRYSFEEVPVDEYRELFTRYEEEAGDIIEAGLVYPAYELVLKCSHIFNLLDARGAISVSERANYIGRVRRLAKACAELALEGRTI